MKKKTYKSFILAGVLMSLLAISPAALAVEKTSETIIILGNTTNTENTPGWMFARDPGNATPFEFNTNKESIGLGSLYVKPIDATAAHKFIGENFINTPVANVAKISYDFLIGNGGDSSDKNQFYMNVYANFGSSNDLKFYDCRYDVVATSGSNSSFTTVTFDPNQSYPVTTRGGTDPSPYTCPSIPANMDNLSAGSNIRMFSLNVGDTSANDSGLDGYLDNVIVETTSNITTYDFEPFITPEAKNDCKDDGWKTMKDTNGNSFKNQGQCVSWVNHQSN